MSGTFAPPPFRADHVSSLLRPPAVLDARRRFEEGSIDAREKRQIEDDAIADAAGTVGVTPPRLTVTGKLRHAHPIQVDDYTYLAGLVSRTPKVSLPSPTMVHFRGGRAALDIESYPDLDEFFADLAQCYRDE